MEINRANFGLFCNQLKTRLNKALPAEDAHLKMASRLRKDELHKMDNQEEALKSAVLVHFYPKEDDIYLSFILRPSYNGVHSGQISFPGGRFEDGDKNIIETALREANEEVNIDPNDVVVLGTLSELYIPPSNYLVTPVVSFSGIKPNFKREPLEVAKIIQAEIGFLFDSSLQKETIIKVRDLEIEAPYFDINGYVVWGATAMILSELKEVIESMN